MKKTYYNTRKGRSEIPDKPGAYNLKNKNRKVIYTGMTNNLNRRIKEHHYDPSQHFSSVSITPTRTKSQAKIIEKRRLNTKKPTNNKLKNKC